MLIQTFTVYLLSKVQELGLQAAYTSDDGVYRYIKKLMALPFLPHREIRPMFQLLRRQAQTQPLQDLVSYINRQWIKSTVFPPKNWSVYRQPVRTNNDIEGWHNALNRRANGQWFATLFAHRTIRERGQAHNYYNQANFRSKTF